MAGDAQTPGITLEQAWHYLMSQVALRNPPRIYQANLARKALRNLMRGRPGPF